jgi:hypothetical protein
MKVISVKHSGNLGDIIYSLSCLKQLVIDDPCQINYYVALDVPSSFTDAQHPVGSVMMNRAMYDMAAPLLFAQPYIRSVDIYEGQHIDYDLDLFRTEYLNLSSGNIQCWISNAYPELRPDLMKPSLFVREIKNDYIIVNRTTRYNNTFIDYSYLSRYDNVFFVGVESEFKRLSIHNKNIMHFVVKDFLELARLIAGCKLFIGNQSMAFAIAELLKVDRVLEQFAHAPNVIPSGGKHFQFHTDKQFKKILDIVLPSLHGKGENKDSN